MTIMQGQPDTVSGASAVGGFAALAQHSPEWDDGPWTVHGVALGEGDTTQGVSGKRVHWPPDVLETAADGLVGKKIVTDRDHDDFERTQPDPETIIGEVTAAKYQPGVGVAYEGELDDVEMAQQVERGRIDVSPMLWRRTGDFDDDLEAYPAEEIVKWRDLATVAEGASAGASIQPGAATALQAEALREQFTDTDTDAQAANEPAESGRGADTDPSTMDLTDDEQALVHAARSTDDPVVVSAGAKDLADKADELALNDFDDPRLVEADEHEQQSTIISRIGNLLTDTIADEGDLRASEAAAMSFEEKFEYFENDDGEFEAEALIQSPEAGGAGDDDDDDDPTGSGSPDALSSDQRTEIRNLSKRAETYDAIDTDHAESLRSEAAEVAGVEEFEDIEMEAL